MGVESRRWREPPPGGAGALASLSVTAWIIIACVAVFVVDGFLPPRMVPLSGETCEPASLNATACGKNSCSQSTPPTANSGP